MIEENVLEKALQNAHEAINYLEHAVYLSRVPKYIKTCDFTPQNGQACWVHHRNGAEYRMTYPFNHEDYPLWYPLPTYCEDDDNSTSSK